MSTKNLIAGYEASGVERLRTSSEILARYNLKREQYKRLRVERNVDREHLMMLFTEAKVLGWVLGKTEQVITHDLN